MFFGVIDVVLMISYLFDFGFINSFLIVGCEDEIVDFGEFKMCMVLFFYFVINGVVML